MAIKNTFNIQADIKLRNKYVKAPEIVQNDTVRFVIELTDNGAPYDLSGVATVSIASERPDGGVVVTPGTVSGNTVTFDLGTNEAMSPGKVKATVQLYDTDGRVSTVTFDYFVRKDPTGVDFEPSQSEKTLIETVMADAQAKIDELSEVNVVSLTTEVETARGSKTTLGGRMDSIDAQLAENATDISTLQSDKADKTYTDNQLALKRDKSTKITNNDLDTSADANKIKLVNLSDEVTQAISGNAPVNNVIADGAVTTEKIANTSITTGKLKFRYLKGIVKQGTLNVNTSTNMLECVAGGVFIDELSYYIAYSDHEVSLGDTPTAILGIYFNIWTHVFEVYPMGKAPTERSQLAFIASYYQNKFNGIQDRETLLINGSMQVSPYPINYDTIETTHLYVAMLNGEVSIDTNTKKITVKQCNVVWGGRQSYIPDRTIDYSGITTPTVNIYFSPSNYNLVCYSWTDAAQLNKKNLILFGSIYGTKVYNCMSLDYVKVNGVARGGWYTPPVLTTDRLYSLNEAWKSWESGAKAPIAFLGDSTTDGSQTTYTTRNVIGTDYINPKAYPHILEQLIKNETGNSTLRVYNAGFHGTGVNWARNNIDKIFGTGTPYADSKMVGISYGINDSVTETTSWYYTSFKQDLEWLINYFKGKNIQPFLLTTQHTRMRKGSAAQAKSFRINTIADQIKYELANKYNLEIIDLNKFTEMFLLYSKHNIDAIQPDNLHFSDIGHQYEGEFYFSTLNPRALKSSEYKTISMLTQNIKTDLDDTQISKSTSSPFKVIVDYTRAETTDVKILDALLFNDEMTQLKLNVVGNVVLKINGTEITDLANHELDLGLHRIEVISRQTRVYFEGINITRV